MVTNPKIKTSMKGTRRVSKLTDRFDELGRISSAPLGFATRPRAETSPTMLLIAAAPASDAEKYAGAKGILHNEGCIILSLRTLIAQATP